MNTNAKLNFILNKNGLIYFSNFNFLLFLMILINLSINANFKSKIFKDCWTISIYNIICFFFIG